jgi:enolase 1/2/3
MKQTAISKVHGWEALDSRGRPTVACRVELSGGGVGRAVVPSGASTGGHEARELRDGEPRYGGLGVRTAVHHVREVLSALVTGMDALERPAVDAVLESCDPADDLRSIGANAVLAVSIAVTVAGSAQTREPLWRVLSGSDTPLIPLPMVNIVSGGRHAAGAVDVQDVLAVPIGASTFAEALEWASRVRAATAQVMNSHGLATDLVADEGGLAAALRTNEQALSLVTEGIALAGLEPGRDVGIAVDIAANQLWVQGRYALKLEQSLLSSAEWMERITGWCERYPIVSIEDVLQEDDWDGWKAATRELGRHVQILGDDHFATNLGRLRRGVANETANAVLIKPNQAGTVTRAERVITEAASSGFATVVSARSGDTEDTWLADFAVGWHAGQIKVGSLMRSERTAKWNRLLEIESLAGASARFAGRSAIPAIAEHADTSLGRAKT